MTGRRVEEAPGGRLRARAQGEAELAVEVAAAERGIMAVGEPKAAAWEAMPQSAQHARLADAGLADEDDRGALVERFEQRIARCRAWTTATTGPRRGSPSRTARSLKPKCARYVRRSCDVSSPPPAAAVDPEGRSSSALGGSNGLVDVGSDAARLRRVLPATTDRRAEADSGGRRDSTTGGTVPVMSIATVTSPPARKLWSSCHGEPSTSSVPSRGRAAAPVW